MSKPGGGDADDGVVAVSIDYVRVSDWRNHDDNYGAPAGGHFNGNLRPSQGEIFGIDVTRRLRVGNVVIDVPGNRRELAELSSHDKSVV